MLNKFQERNIVFDDFIDNINTIYNEYRSIDPSNLPESYKLRAKMFDAFQKWDQANQIIADPEATQKSGKDKIIEFLFGCVGIPVTGAQISHIYDGGAGGDWSRCIRSLRQDMGFDIDTSKSDPRLKVGVYILNSLEVTETHDRNIDDNTKAKALKRDDFCCQKCHISIDKLNHHLPQKRFEYHHIHPAEFKGGREIDNVATLCNVCHVEIHKYNKTLSPSELDEKNAKSNFLKWLNLTYNDKIKKVEKIQADLFD